MAERIMVVASDPAVAKLVGAMRDVEVFGSAEEMQEAVEASKPLDPTVFTLKYPDTEPPYDMSPSDSRRVERLHAERCLSPAWRWEITPAEDRAMDDKIARAKAKRERKARTRSKSAVETPSLPQQDDTLSQQKNG